MLHILIGEDDFSIRQALEEIKKTIGDRTTLLTNTTLLDGRQITPEQLRNACTVMPFLAEKRLVIVTDLLEHFENGDRTPGRKASGSRGQLDEVRMMVEVVKVLPPFTELVIIGGAVRPVNPLLRELAPLAAVRTFPLLKEPQLRRWLEARIREGGGSISPEAVTRLVILVGNNLWIISSEVEKLLMYARGRRIEEADVLGLVSSAQEARIFDMVDDLLEFRTSAAFVLLQQLLRQGAVPAYLLAMITRQLRIIFQVKAMKLKGKDRAEIQRDLGPLPDFLMRKVWDQTDRYSLERLRFLYHRLLDVDVAIKTGAMDGELALEILMAELGGRDTATLRHPGEAHLEAP